MQDRISKTPATREYWFASCVRFAPDKNPCAKIRLENPFASSSRIQSGTKAVRWGAGKPGNATAPSCLWERHSAATEPPWLAAQACGGGRSRQDAAPTGGGLTQNALSHFLGDGYKLSG
jgi:hypothetical protein